MIEPIRDKDVCPIREGEFLPTDCAIVRGIARDSSGQIAAALAIRVDSIFGLTAYSYASNATMTDANGRFELVVNRVNRITPPTVPDTARVELKSYPGTDPKPRDIAQARAWVLMYFAELGHPVRPTVVEAVFDHH